MPKKFTNQCCIHCLNYFDELTKDHIFPESWYPDSTPLSMEKWVVPSCPSCNNKLGEIESELYKKFALCMNSSDIASSGISEKVIRQYFSLPEEDNRTKGRKLANLKKLFKNVKWFDNDKLPNNIAKNFGNIAPNSKKSILINIPPELLNPFCEKIIRGLEFKLMGKLINNDRKIQFLHLPDSTEFLSQELAELNNAFRNGPKIDRGPGFLIQYTKDIYSQMGYHVTIWGRWEIWAAISAPQKNNIITE